MPDGSQQSLIDPRLAEELAKVLSRDPDARGASELIEVLQKVSPSAGARAVSLAAQARAMSLGAPPSAPMGQRLMDGVRYIISGVTPRTWFSPQQPLLPYAQNPDQGAIGRRYDFQQGQNIQFLPKTEANAGVPFQVLRALRESYDLLSVIIETRKDQVCAFDWAIVAKDPEVGAKADQAQVKKCSEFFEQPAPDYDWLEWLRMVVDEHLVGDSAVLYPRLTRGGQLHSLAPIDSATIKRLIDETGTTPLPPDPAYQQIIKGVPGADYMMMLKGDELSPDGNQLLYWMRNPRVNKFYGYSPVEQVITTVNIAMRRQQYQLEYYTEGNIPDALIGVPDTWTPDQTKEFQDEFDSRLEGNTRRRRKLQFLPDVKSIFNLKDNEVALTDGSDEWFARIICFCFSISPQGLMKQMNRASAQQGAETAKEEGLMPLLRWLEGKLTWVCNNVLMCQDVKFSFKMTEEVDPAVKATTNTTYVKAGIISVDEAREDIGRAPVGIKDLMVETATGVVPLKESLQQAKDNILNPPPPPPIMMPDGTTKPNPAGAVPGPSSAKPTASKTAPAAGADGSKAQKYEGPPIHVEIGSPIVDLSGMRIAPPSVKVGGTTLHADLRREANAGAQPRPMHKRMTARRRDDGSLEGEVWEEETGLRKSVTVERTEE